MAILYYICYCKSIRKRKKQSFMNKYSICMDKEQTKTDSLRLRSYNGILSDITKIAGIHNVTIKKVLEGECHTYKQKQVANLAIKLYRLHEQYNIRKRIIELEQQLKELDGYLPRYNIPERYHINTTKLSWVKEDEIEYANKLRDDDF